MKIISLLVGLMLVTGSKAFAGAPEILAKIGDPGSNMDAGDRTARLEALFSAALAKDTPQTRALGKLINTLECQDARLVSGDSFDSAARPDFGIGCDGLTGGRTLVPIDAYQAWLSPENQGFRMISEPYSELQDYAYGKTATESGDLNAVIKDYESTADTFVRDSQLTWIDLSAMAQAEQTTDKNYPEYSDIVLDKSVVKWSDVALAFNAAVAKAYEPLKELAAKVQLDTVTKLAGQDPNGGKPSAVN